MEVKDYQKFVKDGASEEYTKQLAFIGLMGEVGELADVIKKEAIYPDMSKFIERYGVGIEEKIVDEAGDVLWQFINLLNMYNLDFDEIMKYNYNKLTMRHEGIKVSKDGGKR